jgi:hypothetical protein
VPRVRYAPKKFNAEHQQLIDQAIVICTEYAEQGLSLTLRQVYYQFVARGLLPNKQAEYKRLGSVLSDARMAGVMDWDFMIDRTRNRVQLTHYSSPAEMLRRMAEGYHIDLWAGQHVRPIVFVEKDAAIGVVEGVCHTNDVPYFSCRGYTSMSELWAAAQRIREDIENGDRVLILHIGDHDPSGIDMTRDIEDRLRKFVTTDWLLTWGAGIPRPARVSDIKRHMREHMRAEGGDIRDDQQPWEVRRIALTYPQVQRYNPPPNPAKGTDSRFEQYVEATGLDESWELDALDPAVLQNLITRELDAVRDEDVWNERVAEMETQRLVLGRVAENWTQIAAVHTPTTETRN